MQLKARCEFVTNRFNRTNWSSSTHSLCVCVSWENFKKNGSAFVTSSKRNDPTSWNSIDVKISHEFYAANRNNILTCCAHFGAPLLCGEEQHSQIFQMEYWDRARCVINFEKLDAFWFVLFLSCLCLSASWCVYALFVHIFVRCDHQCDVKHSSSFFFPKRRPHTYNGIHIHICAVAHNSSSHLLILVLLCCCCDEYGDEGWTKHTHSLHEESRLQNKNHELKWKTKQREETMLFRLFSKEKEKKRTGNLRLPKIIHVIKL